MMKKMFVVCLAMCSMFSVPVLAGHDLNKTEETYVYPEEDAQEMVWESTLGYSMNYDPTIFTLDDTGEGDSFIYNTAEELKSPVYIAVLEYPDMDAETLASGLALQFDLDEAEIQDTYFGADSLETKCIYIEGTSQEDEDTMTMQVFYAIPKENGSLLVEIMGYEGMPEAAEHAFETMPGSFQLLSDIADSMEI